MRICRARPRPLSRHSKPMRLLRMHCPDCGNFTFKAIAVASNTLPQWRELYSRSQCDCFEYAARRRELYVQSHCGCFEYAARLRGTLQSKPMRLLRIRCPARELYVRSHCGCFECAARLPGTLQSKPLRLLRIRCPTAGTLRSKPLRLLRNVLPGAGNLRSKPLRLLRMHHPAAGTLQSKPMRLLRMHRPNKSLVAQCGPGGTGLARSPDVGTLATGGRRRAPSARVRRPTVAPGTAGSGDPRRRFGRAWR